MPSKTFFLALALSLIGIITQLIFGLTDCLHQLLFTLIAIAVYFLILKVDSYWLLKLAKLASLFSIVVLLIALVLANPTRGSRRWFFIFGFGIQPSLLFVPFWLLTLIDLLMHFPISKFKNLALIAFLIFLPVAMVFKQPDLGTSLVLVLTCFMVLLSAGLPYRYLLLAGLLSIPIFFFLPHFLKPYQLQRLTSFLNPHLDPSGINYNSLQAVIAIGSGGLFGKGFLNITQSKLSFLPEANTDFIFAAFCETFGLFGAFFLILIYFCFLNSLLKPIRDKGENYLFSFYSLGCFAFLFTQFTFNIGMNLRLLPVVGVPLPLISAGGSTVLTIYILLAICEKLRTA